MTSAKARYSELRHQHIKAIEEAISLRSAMVELIAAAAGVDDDVVLACEETQEADWGYRCAAPDLETAVERVRSWAASEGGAA